MKELRYVVAVMLMAIAIASIPSGISFVGDRLRTEGELREELQRTRCIDQRFDVLTIGARDWATPNPACAKYVGVPPTLNPQLAAEVQAAALRYFTCTSPELIGSDYVTRVICVRAPWESARPWR